MRVRFVITNWDEQHWSHLYNIITKLKGYQEVIVDRYPSTAVITARFDTRENAIEGERLMKDYATRACGFRVSDLPGDAESDPGSEAATKSEGD